MYQSQGGFPIGLELRSEIKNILNSAFYINKITMPQADHEMTATETIERMKQYRREALPLFMPVESEYNGQVCEITFDLMMKNNLFGSPHDVPQSLQGAEIEYQFESPLTSSAEEKKVNQFHQTSQLLAEAAQFDPSSSANVNLDEALRDAIKGTGASEFWLNDPKQVAQQRAQQQAQAAAEQGAAP